MAGSESPGYTCSKCHNISQSVTPELLGFLGFLDTGLAWVGTTRNPDPEALYLLKRVIVMHMDENACHPATVPIFKNVRAGLCQAMPCGPRSKPLCSNQDAHKSGWKHRGSLKGLPKGGHAKGQTQWRNGREKEPESFTEFRSIFKSTPNPKP
jgi:hypothetical protein